MTRALNASELSARYERLYLDKLTAKGAALTPPELRYIKRAADVAGEFVAGSAFKPAGVDVMELFEYLNGKGYDMTTSLTLMQFAEAVELERELCG